MNPQYSVFSIGVPLKAIYDKAMGSTIFRNTIPLFFQISPCLVVRSIIGTTYRSSKFCFFIYFRKGFF